MGSRRLYFFIAIFVLIACTTAFLATPEILMIQLVPSIDLPAGTLITWAAMISLPVAIFFALPAAPSTNHSFWSLYRNVFRVLIALGVLWGLVSYGFSGNWNYSFSGASETWRGSDEASLWFWNWTKVVGALPFAFAILLVLHLAVRWVWLRFAQRK